MLNENLHDSHAEWHVLADAQSRLIGWVWWRSYGEWRCVNADVPEFSSIGLTTLRIRLEMVTFCTSYLVIILHLNTQVFLSVTSHLHPTFDSHMHVTTLRKRITSLEISLEIEMRNSAHRRIGLLIAAVCFHQHEITTVLVARCLKKSWDALNG